MNPEFNGPRRSTLLDHWRYFSYNGSTPSNVYRSTKNSKYFIRRLTIKEEVTGHSGCVNTVHWNKSGTILLSGSDDRHLNLYSYPSLRLIERIKSGHRANIFNAKFIPHSNDSKVLPFLEICSCSGDGLMHYNNLLDKKNYGKNPFKCHVGIVYDVVTHNQDPNGFISCGEDGTVRYFDLRTTSSCNCSHCDKNTLIDIKQPITACTLNPFNPNEIVIGCDDSTVRAYDRRFRFTQESRKIKQVGSPQSNSSPVDPTTTGLIYSYRPTERALDLNSAPSHYSNRLTCVTFNWKGDEILASYCPSLLTLFSTTPKINPTSAESHSIRACLFDDCFLFPGGITPESSKPDKILMPYVEQREANDNNDSNSPCHSQLNVNKNSSDENPTSLAGDAVSGNQYNSNSAAEVNSNSQSHSVTIPATGEEGESPLGTSFVGDEVDNIAEIFTTSITEQSVESTPDLEVPSLYQTSTPYNSNQFTNNETYLMSPLQINNPSSTVQNTSSTSVVSAPSGMISAIGRGTSDNIRAENNDSHGVNDNNLEFELNHNNHSIQSGPYTSNNTEGHSYRISPLPRTRSTALSEIYTNFDHDNSASSMCGTELTNTTDNSTFLPHYAGSAPIIESRLLPSTNNPLQVDSQNTIKTQKSRYSAWDCASSSYFKTCVTESTARGPNEQLSSQTERNYNPTFFNSVDSLTTINHYDRLRAYIDDLFVPSYNINYRGHHNSRTMIKECNFYGDDYVMSGSDDGNVFIWDKWNSQLVNIFNADNNVVNCLQPHPIDPVIACSGIDSTIKIIAPVRKTAIPVSDINSIIEVNERELHGSGNYYFDATPTMIFHVLLALERIQRNRGDDTVSQNDQSNPENIREVDPARATREGFRRATRTRNSTFGNPRRIRRAANRHSNEDTHEPSSPRDVDLDSFFESDIYDDDDDDEGQEYSMESSSNSQPSSSHTSLDE